MREEEEEMNLAALEESMKVGIAGTSENNYLLVIEDADVTTSEDNDQPTENSDDNIVPTTFSG